MAVPNDVYLTYSIFILTSTLRVSIFPLHLQTELANAAPKAILNESVLSKSVAQPEKTLWLEPVEGPPVYVSLLGEPFCPPPILRSGLPPIPKLSLPTGVSAHKEFTLTPDTLRYLVKISAQITGQIHELHIAQRAAEARVKLQHEELSRQVEICRVMERTLAKVKQTGVPSIDARLEKVEATQKDLMKRLDRLLQALMAKVSPELSDHETKWFEELKRMKEEVMGHGKYDEGSIVARVKLVCRQNSFPPAFH